MLKIKTIKFILLIISCHIPLIYHVIVLYIYICISLIIISSHSIDDYFQTSPPGSIILKAGPERHIALFHAEGACQAPQAAVDVAAGDLVLARDRSTSGAIGEFQWHHGDFPSKNE